MFAKSFKLVFGVGAAIVATLTLGGAIFWAFWAVTYWIQDPAAQTRYKASRYVELTEKARSALCSELPPSVNRYIKYLDDTPGSFDMPGMKPGTVLTGPELAEAQEKARRNARNRVFVEKAREYCG